MVKLPLGVFLLHKNQSYSMGYCLRFFCRSIIYQLPRLDLYSCICVDNHFVSHLRLSLLQSFDSQLHLPEDLFKLNISSALYGICKSVFEIHAFIRMFL